MGPADGFHSRLGGGRKTQQDCDDHEQRDDFEAMRGSAAGVTLEIRLIHH
jgi:hypothetical protein